MQKLIEEDGLSLACDRRIRIPLDMKTATRSVQRPGPCGKIGGLRGFTRRVSLRDGHKIVHPLGMQHFAPLRLDFHFPM